MTRFSDPAGSSGYELKSKTRLAFLPCEPDASSFCARKWLEEQGFPSGSARRVILRALEISSVLEFRKSGIFSQCDAIFDLQFDRTGKRLNGGISTIRDGSGKICLNSI